MIRIGKIIAAIRWRQVLLVVLMVLVIIPGCSLYYEAKRPPYTDVAAVQPGTPRPNVTAVLGPPVESYTQNGKDVDIFQADPNGRYTGTRVEVSSFNAAADVLTLGMWEVVATPAEMLTKHKLQTYVVTYTSQQTVNRRYDRSG